MDPALPAHIEAADGFDIEVIEGAVSAPG